MQLEQIKVRFPSEARRLETILGNSKPHGRLVLNDFTTRTRIENTLGGTPIVHVSKEFPLQDLCYIRRDLEEEMGFLPNSIDAAINPRIKAEDYVVFGIEGEHAHTLFVVPKEHQRDLELITQLHRLDDYPTYRLFADRRDDIDPVTRLLSRTCLERRARHLFQTGTQGSFYVFATDMDKFKRINKDFGAHKGDLALRIVGSEIAKSLGERGIASRRHYGDELLGLAPKSFFAEIQGGYEAWVETLNSRLAERSAEIGSGVTLRITAGFYDLANEGTWNQAKIGADQTLVFARTRRKQSAIWTPQTPTLDEMQSGRHTRFQSTALAELQTDFQRAFPNGMTPDEAQGAQEIVDEHISKSAPIRNEGNRRVYERLESHLRIAEPSLLKHLTPERVWQSVYQTRSNLNLLTPEERALPLDRIASYMPARYNLEQLFAGPDAEAYNQGLESYGLCRYDDLIKTITASSQSQALSRFIVSGRDKPTTGQLRTAADMLTLLNVPFHFEGCGIVTLGSNGRSTSISFDQGRFDIAPRTRDLASRTNRVINYLGLSGVTVTETDPSETNPHYTYNADDLAALQPVFIEADALRPSDVVGNIRIFSIGKDYGVHLPHLHELLLDRIQSDPAYAATLPANGTEMTCQHAVDIVKQRYGVRTRELTPNAPLFHGTKEQVVRLLADLYLPRHVYLREHNKGFQIHNHRVPDIDTEEPERDEVITHLAREFHRLLRTGPVEYRIEQARPLIEHQTEYVDLSKLMVPVAHRYEELFEKNLQH